jgi:hypothetical protein
MRDMMNIVPLRIFCQNMTNSVETVEKVTFQKLFLKSGTETRKIVWFLVFRTTFWQHFGDFLACCGRFL